MRKRLIIRPKSSLAPRKNRFDASLHTENILSMSKRQWSINISATRLATLPPSARKLCSIESENAPSLSLDDFARVVAAISQRGKAFTFFRLFFNSIWKETRKVTFFLSILCLLVVRLFASHRFYWCGGFYFFSCRQTTTNTAALRRFRVCVGLYSGFRSPEKESFTCCATKRTLVVMVCEEHLFEKIIIASLACWVHRTFAPPTLIVIIARTERLHQRRDNNVLSHVK